MPKPILKTIRSQKSLEQLTAHALTLAHGSLDALEGEMIVFGDLQSARVELDYLREVLDTIDLCLTALAIKRQEDGTRPTE